MKVIQGTKRYTILRFEKGEKFPESLETWLKKENISGAFFYGIGGATKIRCAYYKLSTKEYIFKEFSGDHLEILNITGNAAQLGNHLKIHAHLLFADETLKSCGGHLDWLEVGGTMELLLTKLNPLLRKENEEVGLALLD